MDPSSPLVPLIETLSIPDGAFTWFEENSHHLFMLGEANFAFSKALSLDGIPPRYTSNLDDTYVSVGGGTTYTQVDATRLHLEDCVLRAVQDSTAKAFAWNFPFVTREEENTVVQEALILSTLQSFVLLQEQTGKPIRFALTLQADQFSRWNVLRNLWRTGFQLKGWCPFDLDEYEGYYPCRADGERFPCDRPCFYSLELPLVASKQ